MKTMQYIMGIVLTLALSGCVSIGTKSAYFGYDSRGRAISQVQPTSGGEYEDRSLPSDALITSGYYTAAVAPMTSPWYDRMWSGAAWNSYYDPYWNGGFRPVMAPIGFAPSLSFGFGWNTFRRPRVVVAWGNPWWSDPFYDPWMYGSGWGIGWGGSFGFRSRWNVGTGFGNTWFNGCWNNSFAGIGFARPWYYRPVVGATFIAAVPNGVTNSYRSFGPNRGVASQFDETRGLRVRSTTTGYGPQGGVPSNSNGLNPYTGGARGRGFASPQLQPNTRSNTPSVDNVQVRPETSKQSSGNTLFRSERPNDQVRSFNGSRNNSTFFSSPRGGAGSRSEGGSMRSNSSPSGHSGGGARSRGR